MSDTPSSRTPAATLLRGVDFFSDLDEADLSDLGESFEPLTVASHTRLYSGGDPAEYFFIIVEGEISIFRDEMGKPLLLQARLGPGDYFGEIGLFGGDQRSSARATVTTRLFRVGKDALLTFLEDRPAVALKIQVAAARRHSQNVAAVLDMGQRNELRIRLERRVLLETSFRSHHAVLENLSLGGLCLRGAPSSWQAGEEVSFGLIYQDESLPVAARVSWREEETLGLAFLEPTSEHEEAVQRLLRRLLE